MACISLVPNVCVRAQVVGNACALVGLVPRVRAEPKVVAWVPAIVPATTLTTGAAREAIASSHTHALTAPKATRARTAQTSQLGRQGASGRAQTLLGEQARVTVTSACASGWEVGVGGPPRECKVTFGFCLGLPLLFVPGYVEAWIMASAQRTSLRVEAIMQLLVAQEYPAEELAILDDMLNVGAKLGVRMLDQSRVRTGFTNRASVANLASAVEHPEVVKADVQRDMGLGRLVYLGKSPPAAWVGQGLWVSPIGVVPKPRSVKFRKIFHLSHGGKHSVNERIPDKEGKVPYVSPAEVAAAILEAGADAHLVTGDVEDAYRHLEVYPGDLRMLVMKLDDGFFAETRVGFGSKTGGIRWDTLARALDFLVRKQGLAMKRKTDDVLLISKSFEEAIEGRSWVWQLMVKMGIIRSAPKDFGPARWAVFDGLIWDAENQVVRIALDKRAALCNELQLACNSALSKIGVVRALVGTLTSLLTVLPNGKAFLQEAFVTIADAVQSARAGAEGSEPAHVEHTWMRISATLDAELQWWLHHLAKPEPGPTRPLSEVAGMVDRERPRYKAHYDASGMALGSVWGKKWAQVLVPKKHRFNAWASRGGVDPSALCPGKQEGTLIQQWRTSSMLLEVAALLLAVRAWWRDWAGGHVTLFCDNMGAGRVCHARHPVIAGLLRVLTHLACVHDIVIDVVFVKGVDNVLADPVSRLQLRRFRARLPDADADPSPVDVHPLAEWVEQCAL